MLDLAKRRSASKEVGLIEASLSHAPEMSVIPSRTISSTSYHTLLRLDLPSVAFTDVNQGVASSKSKYDTKLVQCFPIRSAVEIDKALVSVDNPLKSIQTDEAMGVTEATLRHIGRQVFYGRTAGKGDIKGFHGLIDVVDNAMLLDATGSAADAASSVYFVRFGIKDVQLVFGNDSVLKLPPFREETLSDSDGRKFDGMISHLTGWAGIQCVNRNSVVRICNITEQADKGLTDNLLAKALAKFPVGFVPDAVFMSRRSRRQLQEDRAGKVSLQSNGRNGSLRGGSAYAPTPTEFEGIPIIATDSILDTEAIVA